MSNKIAKATPAPDLVEAVVFLRQPKGKGVPAPEVSRAQAARALQQARAASGLEPQATVVFDAMHSLSMRAAQPFIDALAHGAEVAQVVPNRSGSSPLIRPVKKSELKRSP